MIGGDGADVLDGGTGEDVMRGGAGNDSYFVDSPRDRILEFPNDGVDLVNSLIDWTLGAGFDNLSLLGGAAINGTGNDLANIITGNGASNVLNGLGGDDLLVPGDGSDHLIGGEGSDTVSYANADPVAGVGIDLAFNLSDRAASGDTFDGVENIIGSAAADDMKPRAGGSVFGGAGNDTLRTPSGGTLRGDAGSDLLLGSSLAGVEDRFWLQNGLGGDNVSGFSQSSDVFVIRGSEFGIGATLDAGELSVRASDHARTGTAAQFVYKQDTTEIWFDADGTGAISPVLVVALFSPLDAANVLVRDDFLVI